MPLMKGKSQKAFNKNVSTEVNSGKKLSQAVAIAYATKRKSDMISTPEYKGTLQSYGLSSLKNNNGAVTSPQEARQVAAQRSGQSENFGSSFQDYSQKQQSRSSADRFGISTKGRRK